MDYLEKTGVETRLIILGKVEKDIKSSQFSVIEDLSKWEEAIDLTSKYLGITLQKILKENLFLKE